VLGLIRDTGMKLNESATLVCRRFRASDSNANFTHAISGLILVAT
jgi:hypothetical protein